MDVPLVFTGQPEGVVLGGTLSPLLRSLEVSCLPEQIPHEIEVDCSSLRIGGMIYVRDIRLPEEIHVLVDPSAAVVTVTEPGGGAEQPAVVEEEAVIMLAAQIMNAHIFQESAQLHVVLKQIV